MSGNDHGRVYPGVVWVFGDLLEPTSMLHTSLLDRHRPLRELDVVEGLRDGRFAMCTKADHVLIDGVSTMKLM